MPTSDPWQAAAQATPIAPDPWEAAAASVPTADNAQRYVSSFMQQVIGASRGRVKDEDDIYHHASDAADQFKAQVKQRFPQVDADGAREAFFHDAFQATAGQLLADKVNERLAYRNSGLIGRTRATWGDVLKTLPGVGTGLGISEAHNINTAAQAFGTGQATSDAYETLGNHIGDSIQNEGAGFLEKVNQITRTLPAAAAEWMMLAGPAKQAQMLALSAAERAAITTPEAAEAALKAMPAAQKALSYAYAGLARTALRPDKLVEGTLQRMQPQGIGQPGGGAPGDTALSAFRKAALTELYSNTAFESAGVFEGKPGGFSPSKIAASTLKAVGAGELATEAAGWLGGGGPGGTVTQLAQAKTKEDRDKVLTNFAANLTAFGILEGVMHLAGPKAPPEPAQGQLPAPPQGALPGPAQGRLGLNRPIGPAAEPTPEPPPQPTAPPEVLDALRKLYQHGKTNGWSDAQVVAHGMAIRDLLTDAMQRNPNMNRDQARSLFEHHPEGPVKDFAMSVANTFPDIKQVEAPTTPPGSPQPSATPETAQTPSEPNYARLKQIQATHDTPETLQHDYLTKFDKDSTAANAWLEEQAKPTRVGNEPADLAPRQVWQHSGTKFEDTGDGITFTGKRNGEAYLIEGTPGVSPSDGGPYIEIQVMDKEGNVVGRTKLDKKEDPSGRTYSASDTSVVEAHRRQGITEAMHDFANEELADWAKKGDPRAGVQVASEKQSKAMDAVWEKNAKGKSTEPPPEAAKPPETTAPAEDLTPAQQAAREEARANRRRMGLADVPEWRPVKEEEPAPLQEALDKMQKGQNPTEDLLDKMFEKANITPKEEHILMQRTLLARTHDDISKDPEVAKKPGVPYSRERIQQIEAKALTKLGLPGETVKKIVHDGQAEDAYLDGIEKGKNIEEADITEMDRESMAPKIGQRISKISAAERATNRLTRDYLKEAKRGPISPEREQFYLDRLSHINASSDAELRSEEAAAKLARKQAAAGTNQPPPVRPGDTAVVQEGTPGPQAAPPDQGSPPAQGPSPATRPTEATGGVPSGGSAGTPADAVRGQAGSDELTPPDPKEVLPHETDLLKAADRQAATSVGLSKTAADAATEGGLALVNDKADRDGERQALEAFTSGQASPAAEPPGATPSEPATAGAGGPAGGPGIPAGSPANAPAGDPGGPSGAVGGEGGLLGSFRQHVSDLFAKEEGHVDLAKLKEYYDKAVEWLNRPGSLLDAFRATLAPSTRGPEAERAGLAGRERQAEAKRKSDIAQAILKAARDHFDATIAREKDPELRKQKFLQITDAVEGTTKISDLPEDLRSFAQAIRDLTNERTEAVRSRGIVQNFIDDYFGHLWKQTPGQFFKGERAIPTYRMGIEKGLEPVTWNPAELSLLNLRQIDKAVMHYDWMHDLKDAGLWQFAPQGTKGPEGWVPVIDAMARKFVSQPAQPGEPQRTWYTPEPVARLLNNYLQPGLRGNAIFDTIQGAGNTLTQTQLGYSAFHGVGTFLNAQMSAVALGLKQISRFDFAKGTASLIGAPLSPFRNFIEGSKMLKEWTSPGSQGADVAAMVDNLVNAGGRSKMDSFYQSSHIENLRRAIKDVQGGDYAKAGEVAWRALPALTEAMSKPIMEVLVPRLKMGVFADLARDVLSSNPGATPDQVQKMLATAWDSVENRMGQLTYDNLFWNRTLKDVAMVSVRSVGWNLGTIRELGGAGLDVAKPSTYLGLAQGKGLSDRLAYAIALPAVAAIYGAIHQYLATGQGPQELKDYFFPKNGLKNKDGTAARVSYPTYMKDMASLTNRYDEGPYRIAGNAWSMAKSKLNPVMSSTAEMLNNEDFYGAAIRNPNDPLTTQTMDLFKHVLGTAEPFSVQSYLKGRQQGQTVGQSIQGSLGVAPAPAYITRTFDQQRAQEAKRKIELSPLFKKQLQEKRSMGLR